MDKEVLEQLEIIDRNVDVLIADNARLRAALEAIRTGMADDQAYRDCARAALKGVDHAPRP